MMPTLMLAASATPDPMSHVLPHYLFGSSWFTNHHLMSLVALTLGFVVLFMASRAMRIRTDRGVDGYVTKGRIAQIIEVICVFLRDEMARPLLGKLTDKYIYYIWSIFFFILGANLLGLIPTGPILGLINKKWSHFGGTMTGNLAFTGGLAAMSFILMHGIALREQGMNYLKHGCPVPLQKMSGGVLFVPQLLLNILLVIVNIGLFGLEIILGPLIKSFALAMRLMANMVAGHLVLGSLIILVISAGAMGKGFGILGAAAFTFLELFVSFLQAYVFTFLTVIFISLGAAHHDEHHDEEHADHDGDHVAEPGHA